MYHPSQPIWADSPPLGCLNGPRDAIWSPFGPNLGCFGAKSIPKKLKTMNMSQILGLYGTHNTGKVGFPYKSTFEVLGRHQGSFWAEYGSR